MVANKGLIIGGLVLVLVVVGYTFFGSGAETGGKFVSVFGSTSPQLIEYETPIDSQCASFFPAGSRDFYTYLQLSDCPNGQIDCSSGEQCMGYIEAVCSISTEAQCNLNMKCGWDSYVGKCGLSNPSNTGAPFCFTQASAQRARVYEYEKVRFDECRNLVHTDPDGDGYPMGNAWSPPGSTYQWQDTWFKQFNEYEINSAWDNGGWDCDGIDPNTYPGAEDVCDGIDNDCNGIVDNDPQAVATTLYLDGDSDGYGDASQSETFMIGPNTCVDTTGYVTDSTDCNDNSASAYPGATEVCDDIDNNCDGVVDEGTFDGMTKAEWVEVFGGCP
jgi:hypothetical protein